MDLSDYRVLAFATHGLVSGELEGVAEPALVFTPPKTGSEDDDGLLTASEIATLDLDAGLVILSACNTAAADGSS
jgi:CHAT domain-containing protein